MQRDSEEDAWRAIVENYGERVQLDDDLPADPPADLQAGSHADLEADPRAESQAESQADPQADPQAEQRLERFFIPLPQPEAHEVEPEPDAFVPPTPPPLPRLPPDRLLAWVGLFGSPSLLLICVVLNVHLPPWVGYLLVASFIGGFLYLVLKMPRGEDIDPWDDGARL